MYSIAGIALLALLLIGCGGRTMPIGKPACTTRRGCYVYNWTDIAAINAAEDRIVHALAPIFLDAQLEDRLVGLAVIFRSDLDVHGAFQGSVDKVFGEASCSGGRIDIALLDPNISNTSYAHEIAHILDDCAYDPNAADPTHPRWDERGIWNAISQAV